MSKLRALLVGAAAAGALAAGSFAPALASDGEVLDTPIGHLHTDGASYITAEGAESNPDPIDGYVRVDGSGVCVGDNNGADATAGDSGCGADIILNELP